MAGKAHPRDAEGKRLIERLHDHIKDLAGAVPAAFLPNYDITLARDMVAGYQDARGATPVRISA